MDNELLDLANRLRLTAAMIMEDNNLPAVERINSADELTARLQTLATAGGDITVLSPLHRFLSDCDNVCFACKIDCSINSATNRIRRYFIKMKRPTFRTVRNGSFRELRWN